MSTRRELRPCAAARQGSAKLISGLHCRAIVADTLVVDQAGSLALAYRAGSC